MEKLNLTLEQLFMNINESINDKMIGVNFLEIFKSLLIENFESLEKNNLNDLKIMPSQGKILNKEIDLDSRKILYNIEYFDKSVSKIKEKTDNNYLFLTLSGLNSITVYDNTNNEKSIFSNLLKNMGVVLSINTVFTTKIAKNSIILSISTN